jgi:malate/lactate dehydrogenase
LVVWGNHSPTMYADYRYTTSNGDSVKALINDHAWNNDVFLPTVGKRGAAIIEARGLSSAASAANAAIDHVHGCEQLGHALTGQGFVVDDDGAQRAHVAVPSVPDNGSRTSTVVPRPVAAGRSVSEAASP